MGVPPLEMCEDAYFMNETVEIFEDDSKEFINSMQFSKWVISRK
jgi:hypothetical protein